MNWLTTISIKEYTLNKKEFCDVSVLRSRFPVLRLSEIYSYGVKFDNLLQNQLGYWYDIS